MMVVSMEVVNCFKINFNFKLQNIMDSHVLAQSLRKKAYCEIVNESDIMKHLIENNSGTFYFIILSSVIIYAAKDIESTSIKSHYISRSTKKCFEFVFFLLINVLCKNIENAI